MSQVTRGKGEAAATMVVRRAEPQIGEPEGLRMPIALENPMTGQLLDHARANLETFKNGPAELLSTARHHQFLGKKIALCGAGPSLRKHVQLIDGVDHIWGANSAAPYLAAQGVAITAAIGIDQTERMVEDWRDPPDVPHYVASTAHPSLVRHLLDRGRRVVFIHNLCGFVGENEHYQLDWPETFVLNSGATVVPRAMNLLGHLGFVRVDVYGADCWFDDGVVHANGEDVAAAFGNTMLMQGTVDGRRFITRPDLLMSAVDLARQVRINPGHIRLMGDTLAVLLLDKTDEDLDLVMRRLAPGEQPPT